MDITFALGSTKLRSPRSRRRSTTIARLPWQPQCDEHPRSGERQVKRVKMVLAGEFAWWHDRAKVLRLDRDPAPYGNSRVRGPTQPSLNWVRSIAKQSHGSGGRFYQGRFALQWTLREPNHVGRRLIVEAITTSW